MLINLPNPRHIDILPQPDDTTCGPTCLHAVYGYYGDDIELSQVIADIQPLPTGGTLAVNLACHALSRGYRATIYTYNLQVFDPTWFTPPALDMATCLRRQLQVKHSPKLRMATEVYQSFLGLGGVLRYRNLDRSFLAELLTHDGPVLTGLSATYLYGCAREINDDYDDIAGHPAGHFVVLCDYDQESESIDVADPLLDNPLYGAHHYQVGVDQLMGAILLGVITFDANLLIIESHDPPRHASSHSSHP